MMVPQSAGMKRVLVAVALAACGKDAASTTLSHPLLWKAEKDGVASYFLGTMHMGVDAKQLPALVWDRLAAAKTFAMETDPTDPALQHIGDRADRTTLHQELGDAYWDKLRQRVGPEVAAQLDDKKPMIAAIVLEMEGLPKTPAMEDTLTAEAKREHKPVVFLEPASAQVEVLDRWMDARAVKGMLDHPVKDAALLDAYRAGDEREMLAKADAERALAKAAGYSDAEYDQEMTDLLYARNAAWITPIERLHASGGGFIAVGALHLIGERSVLALLARRGFSVSRVEP